MGSDPSMEGTPLAGGTRLLATSHELPNVMDLWGLGLGGLSMDDADLVLGATTPLQDVPAASPFCRWIEELARRGVVSGCGDGNYCPADAVTREQMAVFISATFGLALYGP
jgi:hypothetical protein